MLLLVLLYLYSKKTKNQYGMVKSTIDNNMYLILKDKNQKKKQIKADILARLKGKINKLVNSLSINDESRQILESSPLNLEERMDKKELGYTINKGERIGICLDDTNENELFFVILHELSHVITKDYGHTDKFWVNFEKLISQAIKIGLYDYKDYNVNPKTVCKKEITYTPYKKNKV